MSYQVMCDEIAHELDEIQERGVTLPPDLDPYDLAPLPIP
jgi:hypothetical protein